MKKIILSFFVLLALLQPGFAQDSKVVYYDSTWKRTTPGHAATKIETTLINNLFYRKTYNVPKNYLSSRGAYADTGFGKPLGVFIHYYENGRVSDSIRYNDSSRKVYGYHYYESGSLKAEYHFTPETKKETVTGYDETGNKMTGDYVYEREAGFPGDKEGWKNFMFRTLNPDVPVRKKAPEGKYTVIVRFIVNTDGSLSDIIAETALGYGMEEEALRVIKRSPRWIPAIQFNKPVKAYRRQPITFMVI
ncbi:MAG: energy transducer TonB [Ferruginibacter sp.]